MLRFHDSLTRSGQPFKPLQKGKVRIYNCGPTVYDYVHIGNLRYFLFTDLLRRYLEHKGYEVHQVMNITDVGHVLADADEGDDKMEIAAAKAGKSPQELAEFYTEAFFRDIDRLGIARAASYPRASQHVDEMIAVIAKLLANGCAYKVGGSVYFDVSSFPAYGQLSGNVVAGLHPGARVDVREEKKHPADFALWISNPRHLMQWTAPWGKGYPGWHIECSAMAMKYLGETIDIHTGGEDNKFPHHEAEIAQSECA
ncbi:MAG: class I tRNA ligase family protein, partial [Acidobacteriota bacterium]